MFLNTRYSEQIPSQIFIQSQQVAYKKLMSTAPTSPFYQILLQILQ